MRKLKKLIAIAVAVMVIAGAMPFAGLEGVFLWKPVIVNAAEEEPFDTSKLAVKASGKYSGAAWTMYDNGLLWVVDDKSGETSYSGNSFTVSKIMYDSNFTYAKEDIKYIYWDITAPENCKNTFNGFKSVIEIKLGNTFINTSSNITNMNHMFYDCRKLTTVDVSGLNTSNVTDMASVFSWCHSLTTADVSNFDTSNVTTMENMFCECRKLTGVDLSNFDTSNVTDMGYMFMYCYLLTKIDISNLCISDDTDVTNMFEGCSRLHIIKCPTKGLIQPEISLSGVWCELKDNNIVDRTVEYQSVPTDNSTSITLIRELYHQCDNVTDGTGICSICGIKIIYGDSNNDGKVNISDAVLLKKYLAGYKEYDINLGNVDVNVDNKINVSDAVNIMKYLAGIDVKLGVEE